MQLDIVEGNGDKGVEEVHGREAEVEDFGGGDAEEGGGQLRPDDGNAEQVETVDLLDAFKGEYLLVLFSEIIFQTLVSHLHLTK